MRHWLPRAGIGLLAVLVLGIAGYTGYVGYEGSRMIVDPPDASRDCRTPDVQYGWAYEAINYDPADDRLLVTRNPKATDCVYQGTKAGTDVVTSDGVRIAGWYIPAANGAGPAAPTVVLVHGYGANKSGILGYGRGLHQEFNLVAFDMRTIGRSTGDAGTGGVYEQRDLRAILDWLERTKHPSHIGVLGNSLGAATALAEVRDDPRVEALALDSMHTRFSYQIEARMGQKAYPTYFGTTWAVLVGLNIRTGADLAAIDADRTILEYGTRPLLLIHGDQDREDLPERTIAFYEQAESLGIPVQMEWCARAGHKAAGMPVDICRTNFADWTHDFFAEALAA